MDGRQEVIVGGGAGGSSSGGRTAAAAVALLRVLLDCCCFTELRCCRCLGGTLKNNISCYPHSLGDATKNTTSLQATKQKSCSGPKPAAVKTSVAIMTDTSVMNYALTSASVAPASATSTSTNSMAAAAAFYQQQAAASAALASLDPAVSHHHQPMASAAAASAAALANVDSPARYPWMSITGKASSLFSHSLAHSCMYVQEGAYFLPRPSGGCYSWLLLLHCNDKTSAWLCPRPEAASAASVPRRQPLLRRLAV